MPRAFFMRCRSGGASPTERCVASLLLAVGATLALTLLILAGRLASGDGLLQAVRSAGTLEFRSLRQHSICDSSNPMFAAYARVAAQTPGAPSSLYADTLNIDGWKFQYPPSALLLLDLLPARHVESYRCDTHGAPGPAGTDAAAEATEAAAAPRAPWPPKFWLDLSARLSLLGSIVVSGLILQSLLARGAGAPAVPRQQTFALYALLLVAGLTFYPLAKPYGLGQIQVQLTFLVSLAVLAVLKGRAFAAGLLIGLCVLIKPQLVVLLVWGLLRREAAFCKGLMLVAGVGHALALWRFGLAVHIDYVQTLAKLSRHGEVFWANQSFNGLLNRLLLTGDPVNWSLAGFPAYHPIVRWGTFASSLLIVAAALWFGRGRADAPSRALDFSAMVAAATLASPIAWEHHYGAFFTLLAVALGTLLGAPRARPALLAAVGAAYLLMANALLVPEWFFVTPWRGVLASHLWLGAVLLLAVLLALQTRRVPSRLVSLAEPAPA